MTSKPTDANRAGTALASTETIRWLFSDGLNVATAGLLLAGICNRLINENLPLAGAMLNVGRLDPLVAASRFRWCADNGRVIEEVMLHGMSADPAASIGADVHFSEIAGTGDRIEWRCANAAGFEAEERTYMDVVCLAMAAPLQLIVQRNVTRGLLRAYLGHRSAEKVLNGSVRRGVGEAIRAVVWISDLREFTRFSEESSPNEVIQALNDYCDRLVGAIQPLGGEVLKFVGDGLLAIFPLADHDEGSACAAAIAAVRASRAGMEALDADRIRAGLRPLPFGTGLHLGTVIFGNIGAPNRLDFTAIGPAVNVASRIEGACRSLNCPVLISSEVASRSAERLIALGAFSLRGIARPVELFTLPELAPNSDRRP